jgi:thiol-disulfide isomerase/thioredoxin
MMMAQYNRKTEEYYKLYDKMVTEFKDTDVGKTTKERFSRELKLKTGMPVPDFSFVSMDNPKVAYTKKTLLGRVYLLDFWSTWCGGCVAEMENLHKAYEKFKPKGFEILSLSFDGKLEDVIKFRTNKWKMPWFNSLIEKGFDNDVVKQFDIIGVPSPVLVDKAGKIVALNEDLRGEKLEKMLEKVFTH